MFSSTGQILKTVLFLLPLYSLLSFLSWLEIGRKLLCYPKKERKKEREKDRQEKKVIRLS